MSWAASTLYTSDTPSARAVLLAAPELAGHVYTVDLPSLEQAPPVANGAPTGLLAVRSPGRPTALRDLPDGFDWTGLDGTLDPRLASLRAKLKGDNARVAPPDALLRWVEDLAARVAGPVVWYQAEAAHGDPDAELAWVIDAGGPAKLVFPGEEVSLDRSPALYARQDGRFRRVGRDGYTRDPLSMGLLHLGARLDSPWFLPHSPHFDWGAHRLTDEDVRPC